jgi:hypothetical protein
MLEDTGSAQEQVVAILQQKLLLIFMQIQLQFLVHLLPMQNHMLMISAINIQSE